MSNFDFNEDIDDENRPGHESSEQLYSFEDYLTVRALLGMHFGERIGDDIYNLMQRVSKKIASEMGGTPGIIFNDDGGEFVSFDESLFADEKAPDDEDDETSPDVFGSSDVFDDDDAVDLGDYDPGEDWKS